MDEETHDRLAVVERAIAIMMAFSETLDVKHLLDQSLGLAPPSGLAEHLFSEGQQPHWAAMCAAAHGIREGNFGDRLPTLPS